MRNKSLNRDILAFILTLAFKKFGFKKINRLQVIKALFLLDRENRLTNYRYIKYLLGPFSVEIINDLEKLAEEGYIRKGDNYYEYEDAKLDLYPQSKLNEVKRQVEKIKNFETIIEKIKDVNSLLDEIENLKEVEEAKFGEEIKKRG